jgi:hypothetical protein
MKFRGLKPYTLGQSVEEYLSQSLRSDFLELTDGLHRLTLLDNMESFEYEGTITNGTEVEIRNPLSTPPSGRLVIKHSGDPAIVDGDTEWTSDFVYLKNSGSASATVKVIFFK